jgi:BirA family biotin operon repressor/biotin-[acetyl-CoA-carboxylase] ligase
MAFKVQSLANQVLDRCHSTNDVAKSLAEEGAPHGTWVSARVQEGGRGRLNRKWESAQGNLYLSIVTRIHDQTLWSWAPLTAGVAVARALRTLFPELEVRIKWPNDLWLHGAKLGGILCEGARSNSGSYIVIGIGLNCEFTPRGLDQKAIDLTSARGTLTSPDQVRLPLISSLLNEIETLISQGPQQIEFSYDHWAFFSKGTVVEWGKADDNSSQNYQVLGLGPLSELQVVSQNGQIVSIYADDVRKKLIPKATDEFLA